MLAAGIVVPPTDVSLNGREVDATPARGFATIDRVWQPGDTVELHLPMPIHYSTALKQVEANRDRIALTRGPLVYCAEEADNGG